MVVYKCTTVTAQLTVVLDDTVTSIFSSSQAAFRLICAADNGAVGKTESIEGTDDTITTRQRQAKSAEGGSCVSASDHE